MSSDSGTVKTVETAFRILQHIQKENEAGLTEIANDLGMPKSTTYRHLQTLQNIGFLSKQDDTYRIGLRFLDLGMHARRQSEFFQVAKPKVDLLAEETGEKVWCVAEDSGRGINIYAASSKEETKLYSNVGEILYLHQRSAGKAILSTFPDSEVREIIDRHGLPPLTEQTIVSPEALFEELNEIRERGYAFNIEESVKGLHAVGSPVKNEDGRAIGGVSVSGPANRLTGSRLRSEIPDQLCGITNEIELDLAYLHTKNDEEAATREF